jgi:hypothetical protein
MTEIISSKKNVEWHRENMATYGIMKSFDPIK